MRWFYKFVKKSGFLYYYSYSRDIEDYTGLICYDVKRETICIEKPCTSDEGLSGAPKKAARHFDIVIKQNFPEQITIDCG